MTLQSCHLILLWHLCWSLWAFTFSNVTLTPLPGMEYVVDYILKWLIFLLVPDGQLSEVLSRAKQVRRWPRFHRTSHCKILVLALGSSKNAEKFRPHPWRSFVQSLHTGCPPKPMPTCMRPRGLSQIWV
jgi:hypothetical protein